MREFNKLRGRIKQDYGNERDFSKKIGMKQSQLSNRLNGKLDFKLKEIQTISNVLKLTPKEVIEYFL